MENSNLEQPSEDNNSAETPKPLMPRSGQVAVQELNLKSKKTWFWVGITVAILNPIFAGLIMGVFFLTEPELKKEGRIVLVIAIVFGSLQTYLVQILFPWMIQQGLI